MLLLPLEVPLPLEVRLELEPPLGLEVRLVELPVGPVQPPVGLVQPVEGPVQPADGLVHAAVRLLEPAFGLLAAPTPAARAPAALGLVAPALAAAVSPERCCHQLGSGYIGSACGGTSGRRRLLLSATTIRMTATNTSTSGIATIPSTLGEGSNSRLAPVRMRLSTPLWRFLVPDG